MHSGVDCKQVFSRTLLRFRYMGALLTALQRVERSKQLLRI
jgi:hypothetical protein